MKRLLVVLAVTLGLASLAHAATCDPRKTTCLTALDVTGGTVSLWNRTLAQINLMTPAEAGLMVYCTNCVMSPICISSGTAVGAWTVLVGTAAATAPYHCQ